MSSEVNLEAKSWLQDHKNAEINSLDRDQTEHLLAALYAAGADNVYIIKPALDSIGRSFTDTLHISASVHTVASVMARLANFHPDETSLLKDESKSGTHLIRAWWD
jgi:Flp pilus assembly protein TadD